MFSTIWVQMYSDLKFKQWWLSIPPISTKQTVNYVCKEMNGYEYMYYKLHIVISYVVLFIK